MDKVRAKMRVEKITRFDGIYLDPETGQWKQAEQQQVSMGCVIGGSPEDNTFASATPSGQLEITITNPATVGFFELGKSYYVDLTRGAD